MDITIKQISDNLREIVIPDDKMLIKCNEDGEIIQSITNTAMLNNFIDLGKFTLIDKPKEVIVPA